MPRRRDGACNVEVANPPLLMRRVIDQDGVVWVCDASASQPTRSSSSMATSPRVAVRCLSAEQQVTLHLPASWQAWSDMRLASAIKGEQWRQLGAPALADLSPRHAVDTPAHVEPAPPLDEHTSGERPDDTASSNPPL